MSEIRNVGGLPVTPYNGTGGWSGTQTSKDRAERMVSTGDLSRTQGIVVQQLAYKQMDGCTVHEISIPTEDGQGWMHHGSISGALSNLHQHGKISRLASKRNNCHIYCLNTFVRDRELSPFTPHKKHKTKFSLSDKAKPNPKAVADYLMRQPLMVKVYGALIPITPQVAEEMANEISDLL